MEGDLPRHYFRIRENGAAVFRVDDGTRSRRLELEQIAVVNVRSGEIKPQGGHRLSPQDETAIAQWLDERRALLHRRQLDDVRLCVERLNMTAHWAQSKATDTELADTTDALILAMHDLRAILVRKKAERLARSAASGPHEKAP